MKVGKVQSPRRARGNCRGDNVHTTQKFLGKVDMFKGLKLQTFEINC